VNRLSANGLSVNLLVGESSVGQSSVGQSSVGESSVGESSVGELRWYLFIRRFFANFSLKMHCMKFYEYNILASQFSNEFFS
jgi:hypothetical protein